jgi:hypothetical protein
MALPHNAPRITANHSRCATVKATAALPRLRLCLLYIYIDIDGAGRWGGCSSGDDRRAVSRSSLDMRHAMAPLHNAPRITANHSAPFPCSATFFRVLATVFFSVHVTRLLYIVIDISYDILP